MKKQEEINGKPWVFNSKLETYPNPNYLGIHTRAPLCDVHQLYIEDRDPEKKGFSVLTSALIVGLEQISGVTKISLQRHRVSIQRSPLYSWDEILEKAVPIFVSYCPADYHFFK